MSNKQQDNQRGVSAHKQKDQRERDESALNQRDRSIDGERLLVAATKAKTTHVSWEKNPRKDSHRYSQAQWTEKVDWQVHLVLAVTLSMKEFHPLLNHDPIVNAGLRAGVGHSLGGYLILLHLSMNERRRQRWSTKARSIDRLTSRRLWRSVSSFAWTVFSMSLNSLS